MPRLISRLGILRRELPSTLLYAAIALMLVLHFALPVMHLLARPWVLLGLLPVVGGVALNVAGNNAFRARQTGNAPFTPPRALVTTGVYRYTRNPQYLGSAIVLAGIALLLGTLTPWIGIVIFVLAVDRLVIRAEERILSQHFDAPYRAYQREVRRWL